jgi:hypothetical protein
MHPEADRSESSSLFGEYYLESPTFQSEVATPFKPDPPPVQEATRHELMLTQMAQRIANLEVIIRQLIPMIQRQSPPEIRKSQLDRHCQPLFQNSPEPGQQELIQLARVVEESFPGHERRALMSAVRRWFRKKREEIGLKVVSALKRFYGDRLIGEKLNIMTRLQEGSFEYAAILEEASIVLELNDAVISFCRDKIMAHVQRL